MNLLQKKMKIGQKYKQAFTLVELLVVIAIIGILAAMVLWGVAAAKVAAINAKVKGEMSLIQGAIGNYQSKMGFYPPDNPLDPTTPPLFYELVGTRLINGSYQPLNFPGQIGVNLVKKYFGIGGFANSNPETVQNFFPGIKKNQQYTDLSLKIDVQILVVPVEGPLHPDYGQINTWRYNSSNPVHNPGKYDLWAEVIIKGETNIIGNWKQ